MIQVNNDTDITFNDKKIQNTNFAKINCQPAVDSHLTPKIYVDNAIDETSLVRNNQDNDFNNFNLTDINSITLKTKAVKDNRIITKSHVDRFHAENQVSRRNLGLVFYNEATGLVKSIQDNKYNDNKLKKLDTTTVSRKCFSNNDLANRKILMTL